MSTATLHPRTAEVIAALTTTQQIMHELLDGLSAADASRVTQDGTWSVAQIIEHLAIVEDGTGRLIGKVCKQLEGTVDPDTDAIAPTLAHFQIWDAKVIPIDAPASVAPKGTVSMADALAAQSEARRRVIEALTAASGRALGSVSFPHPFLGPLNGYQWALFLAQHQERHLIQLRGVLAALRA